VEQTDRLNPSLALLRGLRASGGPTNVSSARVSSANRGSRTDDAGVKLINTDGMSFIGPGSEWFWTALSGLVLAVTFSAFTGSSASPEAQTPSSR
jgi:hypothetical protein